jgi:hypothetical protein
MEINIRKAQGGFVIVTAKLITNEKGQTVVKDEKVKVTREEMVKFVDEFFK